MFDILIHPVEFVKRHAAHNPTANRSVFVINEIHAGGIAQHREDRAELRVGFSVAALCALRRRDVRMPAQAGYFARDALGRQDEIDAAGQDSAPWHAVVTGGLLILREGNAALGLDGFQAQCTVRCGSGQDHPYGLTPLIVRQGAEEVVDGHMGRLPRPQPQNAFADADGRVRRNHVDLVGLHPHRIRYLAYRHGGGPAQKLGQHAGVLRVQVLDQHERDSRVDG
jgi:hypothetical protein